jgi:hypothetical protein
VHIDVDGAHVIVIRPMDNWNPSEQMADRSLNSLKKKMFGFNYVDASGAKVAPRPGGMLSSKIATPLSDDVYRMMDEKGWKPYVAISYAITAPLKINPLQMSDLARIQNKFYKASVVQQGDPSKLGSKESAKIAGNVLATVLAAGFGISKLGADTVNLSQYSTLYTDFSNLTGTARSGLLPLSLPEYDFSSFTEVEIRRVTDNAGNVGEIIIGYRTAKTSPVEQSAFAHAIASVAGLDTTVEEVEAARKQNYEQRLAIWSECQSTTACAQQ